MTTDISINLTQTTDSETEEVEEKALLCKSCGLVITHSTSAIQPYQHTFRNPAGYSYHVLCFGDAPGSGELGTPTEEFCWFPGYSWTYAVCKQCGAHLGWWYHRSSQTAARSMFAGLIATRLVR